MDEPIQGEEALVASPEVTPASTESESSPQPEVQEQAPVSEESVVESTDDDLELPEEANERTRKQFEKLKSRLKEKDQQLAEVQKAKLPPKDSSIFDFRKQPEQEQAPVEGQPSTENLSQAQVEAVQQQFINEDGTVDVDGYNRALQDANARAEQASQTALQAEGNVRRWEEQRQENETHAVYPQLAPYKPDGSPNPEYDPEFRALVRDRLVSHYVNSENVTYLQAAQSIADVYQPQVSKEEVAEEAVADYKQSQENRQQGPVATGSGERRGGTRKDRGELRQMMYSGDRQAHDSALTERINRATTSE